MTRIEDPYHFLDLAFGYYITSRFAAINQLRGRLVRSMPTSEDRESI